ncbi:uncharacterized protein LOC110271602 [Arachis ipaensis]|uniref:uncharacterized protein LOC110271602 n=1 Tax=Arachis ipaensis TaxID=130454 RepID=UPI000A2B889C|nr:uncharacterized protein LOC110271602 [Arachis ipaensis]XP_025648186.1 uncharacterized protein LOC112743194 [Arachis hypogaea]
MAWAIELSQYDLHYEPWQAIKAQAMADFLVEVTGEAPDIPNTRWKLHVDGVSNQMFGGAGIILESSVGVAYEQSIKFDFPVSNNQAEYEALIGGLILAKEVRTSRIEVSSDSQIVTSQINGSYQARDTLLQKYPEKSDDGTPTGVDLLGPFPPGSGQIKYLIVAIDYYTKWVEAEPLASISSANCQKFMWRQVVTRFRIPEFVVSDNGTQFTDKKFKEFRSGLGIKQNFSSVEHPQSNGQVEAANKVILKGLKKRLEGKKGSWADKLGSVLWSYRTSLQSSTGKTPFRLTYGVDAVIPIEIGEPSPRLLLGGGNEAIEKDLVDETR